MKLRTEKYSEQLARWPDQGRHILAQFDDESVVVYQAYRPAIGLFAIEHQRFGGAFSFSRMSWIKPNFLWMMYRSGWGKKTGQEIVLAIRLKREYFNEILRNAIPSTNLGNLPQEEWKQQVTSSAVRLQWDPDHRPCGQKEERRAIQLGLRNEFLKPFDGEGIIEVIDMRSFVAEQYELVKQEKLDQLVLPAEELYPLDNDLQKVLFI